MTDTYYIQRSLICGEEVFSEDRLLGMASVIVVLAEPGAGKTELLKSLAGRLGVRPDKASIFRHRNSTAPPEYLVLDALDEVAKLDPSGIDAIFVKAQETGAKLVIFWELYTKLTFPLDRLGPGHYSRLTFVEGEGDAQSHINGLVLNLAAFRIADFDPQGIWENDGIDRLQSPVLPV